MLESELGQKQQQIESMRVMWEEKETVVNSEMNRKQQELLQSQQINTEYVYCFHGYQLSLSLSHVYCNHGDKFSVS